ncbi:MAG TPA: hypothetical protein VFU47_10710, partial [Armatimonadota bacterium]|nr:hypothetical protein [Armatimonadota bacterium]
MPVPRIDIDLALPPEHRWEAIRPYREQARGLLRAQLEDLGDTARYAALARSYVAALVPAEHRAELAAVAALLGVSFEESAIANLTYDALKLAFGCTAFAVNTERGPLHGRNLDWSTLGGQLARGSVLINYHHGPDLRYRVVGWPGFLGALSGVAPGRFSVTLNAVMSEEPA